MEFQDTRLQTGGAVNSEIGKETTTTRMHGERERERAREIKELGLAYRDVCLLTLVKVQLVIALQNRPEFLPL